ncbi:MAG TPA: hypothetical protein VMH26_07720 [Burkholderiales bacterium]|nr:hypothetical protein [Burkholderiales bacterium]
MNAIRDQGETGHRNVICCLLVLEIADYDAKPVFDQIRLTQDFQQLVSDTTAYATCHDLLSIVREDCALLSFLADPQECFTTALAMREATLTQPRHRDLPLRMGINLGTVQIGEDEFGHAYVSGEGRQDALRVMRQGPPRQLSVARPFFELLSRAAPELAGLLEYQGVFSDTVGPPLCLYRLPPPDDAAPENLTEQPLSTAGSLLPVDPAVQSKLMPQAVPVQPTTRRHGWLGGSGLRYALVPLLAGAAALTPANRVDAPAVLPAAQLGSGTPQATVSEAIGFAPVPVTGEQMSRAAAGPSAALASARRPPAAARPAGPRDDAAPSTPEGDQRRPPTSKQVAQHGRSLTRQRQDGADESSKMASALGPRSATLLLAIRPWGEVYVDGRKIGVTPPLKRFDLVPGRRVITIKNSFLPTFRVELTADPEAEITVAHDFGCVSDREKPCREGFSKGPELQSRFKLETAEAGHSPHLR